MRGEPGIGRGANGGEDLSTRKCDRRRCTCPIGVDLGINLVESLRERRAKDSFGNLPDGRMGEATIPSAGGGQGRGPNGGGVGGGGYAGGGPGVGVVTRIVTPGRGRDFGDEGGRGNVRDVLGPRKGLAGCTFRPWLGAGCGRPPGACIGEEGRDSVSEDHLERIGTEREAGTCLVASVS